MIMRMFLAGMAALLMSASVYGGAYTLKIYNLTSTILKYHVDVAGADWLFKEWDGSLAPPQVGKDGKIKKVHGAQFSPAAANCFGYVKVTAEYGGKIGSKTLQVDLTCASKEVTFKEVCTDQDGDGKPDNCELQWDEGKPDKPTRVTQG